MGKFLSIIVVVAIFGCLFQLDSYGIGEKDVWKDSTDYLILDVNEPSNNDLNYALAKIKYDFENYQIHILFHLSFTEMNIMNDSGVVININDLGDVIITADGKAEFNDEIYFAHLDGMAGDENSQQILLEITLGLKEGFPDEIIMDVYFYDTNSARSNTYSLNITPNDDIAVVENADNEIIEKTTAPKTKKTRITKNNKVTKNAKATKSKSKKKVSKTKKSASPDEEKTSARLEIYQNEPDEKSRNEKKILVVIAAASFTALCIATACATGIKYKKNKEKNSNLTEG